MLPVYLERIKSFIKVYWRPVCAPAHMSQTLSKAGFHVGFALFFSTLFEAKHAATCCAKIPPDQCTESQ